MKSMTFLSHFPALISVHDIMPETLPRLKEMVGFFDRLNIKNVYLLIVPDRQWEPVGISYIRSLNQRGYHLAGHGWQHECLGKKKAYHRIHAAFFSRNAAEHLSCKTCEGVTKLICRCYFWFEKSGLPPRRAMFHLHGP